VNTLIAGASWSAHCRFDLPDLVGGRAPYPPPGLRPRRAAQRTHGRSRRRARQPRAMRGRTPGVAPRDRGTRDQGAGRHLDQATDDVDRARAGDRPDPPPPRHATARRPANGSGNQRRCAQAPTTSDGPRTVYLARTASRPYPAAGCTRFRAVPAAADPPHTVTNRSRACPGDLGGCGRRPGGVRQGGGVGRYRGCLGRLRQRSRSSPGRRPAPPKIRGTRPGR
jgi:hypothetical protein